RHAPGCAGEGGRGHRSEHGSARRLPLAGSALVAADRHDPRARTARPARSDHRAGARRGALRDRLGRGGRRIMKHLRICALALALFTAQATLPSCLAGYEQGTAVTLAVSGALDGAVDAGGRAIRIDRAFLHVSSAELVACEERAERLRWVSVALAGH